MHIRIIGPAHPFRGGPATFNDRLARQFADEGMDIEISTFTVQYPSFLFPGKTQFTEVKPPSGIIIKREINTLYPVNWIVKGLKIKKEKPDLLLLRYWLPFLAPCLGTIARIVRKNHYTKVVCIFDNVVPHEKRPGDMMLTKFFVNSIDGAVVMSNTVSGELQKYRNDIPILYNPHPLFDNYGNPADKENSLSVLGLKPAKYLLFFGFVREYKGLDLLLEAFSDNRMKEREIKLIVAGEFYENEKRYKELIHKYDLSDKIIIYNRFIRDDEVPLFFSVADILVQPYKSASQSGVTQIAFHFGLPMLVTDVGGLREVVTNGVDGYVVSPDPVCIAENIVDYYDNDRRDRFSESVKKKKEKFSWDKMTNTIIRVYKQCT